MEARVAVLEQMAQSTEQLLIKIDARLDRMEIPFIQMDKRLELMEKGFEHIGQRLDRVDIRMDRLEDRQASDFKWLLGSGIAATTTLLAAMLGLLGTMAHGFHWI